MWLSILQTHSQQILNYDGYYQEKPPPCKKRESADWTLALITSILKLSIGLNDMHLPCSFVYDINSYTYDQTQFWCCIEKAGICCCYTLSGDILKVILKSYWFRAMVTLNSFSWYSLILVHLHFCESKQEFWKSNKYVIGSKTTTEMKFLP